MVIAFIIFWVFYYWLEGTHDGYVTMQLLSRAVMPDSKDKEYSLKWHNWSTFQHAWLHIVAPLLLATSLWQYIILLNISIALRVLLHDYFIMATRFGWKAALTTYPTYDYKGDWWDGILVYLKNKGVSQYALKFIYLTGSILLWALL